MLLGTDCRPSAEYGKRKAVYRYQADGCDRGIWPRRMAYRQADPDLSAVRWDSTVGHAHASAACAPQKETP